MMIIRSKLWFLGMGLLLPLSSIVASTTPAIPLVAPANPVVTAPVVNKPVEIMKDVWLEQVKLSAAVPICKSFIEDEAIAEQMKVHSISYEKCVSLIPSIAEACGKKYDAEMPLDINEEGAEKWGKLIGECIGSDFATNYLYK